VLKKNSVNNPDVVICIHVIVLDTVKRIIYTTYPVYTVAIFDFICCTVK